MGKPKKSDRQKAIKKADTYCSQYVRIANADQNGYCKCYTCGKIKHWKEIQCGHRIGRKYMIVRWDLDNLRPQCFGCNSKTGGNGMPVEFQAHLVDEIGIERVHAVEEKAMDEVKNPGKYKIDTPDILDIAQMYKDLLKPYKHLMT